MTKISLRPYLWILFSAGGMLTALLAPVLILLFGLAIPLHWVSIPDHGRLLAVSHSLLVHAALLGLCVLAFFHWSYRFYHILRDTLRLKHRDRIMLAACYAGAIAGSAVSSYIIFGS